MATAGLNFIRDAMVYEAELSSSDAVTFMEGLTNIRLWIADLIKEVAALELMYEGVQKEFTGILEWVGVEVKEYLDKQSTLDCMAFMDESFANLCNFSDVFNISSSDHGDGHNPSLTANITEGKCVFYSTADIPHTSHIWHHCSVGQMALPHCVAQQSIAVQSQLKLTPGAGWGRLIQTWSLTTSRPRARCSALYHKGKWDWCRLRRTSWRLNHHTPHWCLPYPRTHLHLQGCPLLCCHHHHQLWWRRSTVLQKSRRHNRVARWPHWWSNSSKAIHVMCPPSTHQSKTLLSRTLQSKTLPWRTHQSRVIRHLARRFSHLIRPQSHLSKSNIPAPPAASGKVRLITGRTAKANRKRRRRKPRATLSWPLIQRWKKQKRSRRNANRQRSGPGRWSCCSCIVRATAFSSKHCRVGMVAAMWGTLRATSRMLVRATSSSSHLLIRGKSCKSRAKVSVTVLPLHVRDYRRSSTWRMWSCQTFMASAPSTW